jgi:hypothetical protein
MPDETRPNRYTFSKDIDEKLEQLLYGPAIAVEKDAAAATRRFEEASDLYSRGYAELRARAPSTHEAITRAAQRVAKITGGSPEPAAVVAASTAPDTTREGRRLFYEGHFYGTAPDGGFGNYMPWVFTSPVRALMAAFDDIEETARRNFLEHARLVAEDPSDATRHGWALHYLQDLTNPHHARNLPIFLRRPGFDLDTHHAFEVRANKRFVENDARYDDAAEKLLGTFRQRPFDLTREEGREQFVDEVHGRALGIADGDWIKHGESKDWDPKIDEALTLAIAATALFVEQLRA